MTESSSEISIGGAQHEAGAQIFRDLYLYGRLLEWVAADTSVTEQVMLEQARASVNQDQEIYAQPWYWRNTATIEAWREQATAEADALLHVPAVTKAEHVANDLHRFAQLNRLARQVGRHSRSNFGSEAVVEGITTLCAEPFRQMRQLARQPEARDLSSAVLRQLLDRDDAWARVAAADFVIDYATQDFADAHRAIDALAHDPDDYVRHALNRELFKEELRKFKHFTRSEADVLAAYREAVSPTISSIHPFTGIDIDARYRPVANS